MRPSRLQWSWSYLALLLTWVFAPRPAGAQTPPCVDYGTNLHWIGRAGSASSPDGTVAIAIDGARLYLAHLRAGISIIDISNPEHPAAMGRYDTNRAFDVEARGNLLYVADGGTGVRVVDVANPWNPTLVRIVHTNYEAHGLALLGNELYVADGNAGLTVMSVASPLAPVIVGSVDTPGFAHEVSVSGGVACVADSTAGVELIDVSNPLAPVIVGNVAVAGGSCRNVAIDGGRLYVAAGAAGLVIADISDPAHPTILGSLDTPGTAQGVALDLNTAYVADYTYGLEVIDVSNPSAPVLAGRFPTRNVAYDTAARDSFVFVTNHELGVHVLRRGIAAAPAALSLAGTPATARHAVIKGPHAIVGDDLGLRVIDISNPAVPVTVGTLATPSRVYEIELAGNHACLAEGNAFQIADLSAPSAPVILGTLPLLGGGTNVAVKDHYAFINSSDFWSGTYELLVVDIADPTAPTVVREMYVGASDPTIVGDYLYFVSGSEYTGWVSVYDIHDALVPLHTATVQLGNYGGPMSLSGNRLFVGEYDSEVSVIDVSSPGSPSLVSTITVPDATSSLDAEGDLLYVRDRTSGVMVIDVSVPASPRIVGGIAGFTGRPTAGSGLLLAAGGGPSLSIYSAQCVASMTEVPSGAAIAPGAACALTVTPNPGRGATTIQLALERKGPVTISIHDVSGRLVRTVGSERMSPGVHRFHWDGRDDAGHQVTSGIYFVRAAGEFAARVSRIVLVR